MSSQRQHASEPWWLMIPLWGLDIPLAALSWGVAIAALFQITMLTAGPLLLLTAAVWVVVLFSRVLKSLTNREWAYAAYYRSKAAPMALLGLGALLAAVWMLFFHVGQYLINFALLPLLLGVIANLPLIRRLPPLRLFCSAAAFVFACAAPAYFFSYVLSPWQMLFSSQLWCLVGLFLLFLLERHRIQEKSGPPPALAALCLMALFMTCCCLAYSAEPYHQGFYITIAMGAACLHALNRLRSKLSPHAWFACSWALMTAPALLGVLVYAPETWGM